MSIYGDVLSLQKTEGEINHLNALTQLDQMRAQQTLSLFQADQASKEALRNYELTKRGVDQLSQGTAPITSPIDANPRLKSIADEMTKAKNLADQYREQAALIRQNKGNQEDAQKLDDNAKDQQQIYANHELRLLAERKDIEAKAGAAAGAANEANWPQVKAALDAAEPGWDKGKDVDFSPLDGSVVWGPKTATVAKTMGDQALTRYQQLEVAEKAAQLQRQSAADAARKAEFESRDRHRAAQEASSKEGLELRRRALEDRENKGDKAVPFKAATKNEVDDEAATFADEHNLNVTDSRKVARDVYDLAADISKHDPTLGRKEALDMARAQVTAQIKPGEPYKPGWWGTSLFDTKGTKATYSRTEKPDTKPPSETEAAAVKMIEPAAKAGLDVVVTNGVMTGRNGGPVKVTTKEQVATLPKGTRFVGPDGKEWVRK